MNTRTTASVTADAPRPRWLPPDPALGPSRSVEVASFCDIGLRRHNNEDRILVMPEASLFAVADGIGGCEGGELAAEITVETLKAHAEAWPSLRGSPSRAASLQAEALLEAIEAANTAVCTKAKSERALQDMGTTIVACSVVGDALVVAHVGDSRLYLQRGDLLYRLTDDHVTFQDWDGRVKEVLTRCVGWPGGVRVDVKLRALQPGDVILLCSDGLYSEVDDEGFAQELGQVTSEAKSLADAASNLLETALKNGGRDNVSGVLIKV
jgi:protein phosphatase